jgi:hypothetical protein
MARSLDSKTLLSITCIALTGSTGCGLAFNYDARPLPPPPRTQAQACYYEGRLEVSTGGTEYNTRQEVGAVAGLSVSITKHHSHRGLIFYRGGKRLTAEQTMTMLRDGALQRSYGDRLERMRGREHAAKALTWSGLGLGLAGCGLMFGALDTDEYGEHDMKKVYTYVGIGSGVALIGTTLIFVARAYNNKVPAEVYGELFMEKPLVPRLVHAIKAHNQQVARQCGYGGVVDVPVPHEYRMPGRAGVRSGAAL